MAAIRSSKLSCDYLATGAAANAALISFAKRKRPRSSCWFTVANVRLALLSGCSCLQQSLQIKLPRIHREFVVDILRPLAARAVPVEFNSVVVEISKIEGFADAVVGGSVERN